MVGREGETFSNRVSTVSREYQNFPNSYLLFTKVSMCLSINGRVRKYSNAGYSSVGGVIHCAVQYIIMIHCAVQYIIMIHCAVQYIIMIHCAGV